MSAFTALHRDELSAHHKPPFYLPVYERHFARFMDRSPVVLEIGVDDGTSLMLWRQMLGGTALVAGIDIDEKCRQYNVPYKGIAVFIGDQSDEAFLKDVVSQIGSPDIIIDDGSHKSDDMRKSFEVLYPLMTRNGVYVVEDLQMCYLGGKPVAGSFLEFCKSKIDDLHSAYHSAPVTKFAEDTADIHIYHAMVVFERGPNRVARQLAVQNDYLDYQEGGSVIKQMKRTEVNP